MRASSDHHHQPSFLGRMSSNRRSKVASMDTNHEQELELLDLFQNHVAARFSDIDSAGDHTFLSIAWLRKLLDAFLCCESEFKAILLTTKPTLDRLVFELLDRYVKALDVCNAVMHGIDVVKIWHRSADIAVCALGDRPIREAHIRRARRAMASLLSSTAIDERENSANNGNTNFGKSTERTWSLNRRGSSPKTSMNGRGLTQPNTNWSATRQIQAMSIIFGPPRGGDVSGIALPLHIMSAVLVFVMWILLSVIPCQDRSGLSLLSPVPKNLWWAQSVVAIQEKISEEWKKRDKRNGSSLLEEAQGMEKVCMSLMELSELPMEEERTERIGVHVDELTEICRRMEEGLEPLQRQIREIFHRLVRSRTEVLEVLDQTNSRFSSSSI